MRYSFGNASFEGTIEEHAEFLKVRDDENTRIDRFRAGVVEALARTHFAPADPEQEPAPIFAETAPVAEPLTFPERVFAQATDQVAADLTADLAAAAA